jgi:hypothetical protein
MIAKHGDVIIHNVSIENIIRLIHLFAKLTPEGWRHPAWIDALYESIDTP